MYTHLYSPQGRKQQRDKLAHSLTKADMRSLDFTVNRVLMKIFKTGNVQIVQECQVFLVFNCQNG